MTIPKLKPMTELKRRTAETLAELAETREPMIITQHGKPAGVLVDVETWEAQRRERDMLAGIAIGEAAIREGRVVKHEDVVARLRNRWKR